MVKRGLVVAVGGASIVVAGLAGCSSDNKSSGSSSNSSASSGSASAGASSTKVTIDGQDQNVKGTVVCSTVAGSVNIAIGAAATGVAAVLSTDSPPTVKSVALGNVNGVTLGFTPGLPGGANATATKDGTTYKVTGTATGIDMANPMTPVSKPFEIDVTCP
jgi:lipoprotein LpqH